MDKIYEKLKEYNLSSAIEFESNDRQFIALEYLWNNLDIKDIYIYLSFIITNSIICYQLSWKWEDYWEEFSLSLLEYINWWWDNILTFFIKFLPNSKNNKRFINIKMKRIEKIKFFLKSFKNRELFYYENLNILLLELSIVMNQKKTAKTIVFAVKMFSYWARACFWKLIYFPEDISIPIDSRLIKIYERYSSWNLEIEEFYEKLSEKLKIPQLHLDGIIWNSKDLIP